MMKTYLEAIRCLPDEWVDDDTHITWIKDKKFVEAFNPKLGTMLYIASNKSWQKATFKEVKIKPQNN